MTDDKSPFAAGDPVNDPFSEQPELAPLLAGQMAIDPPASLLTPTSPAPPDSGLSADSVEDPLSSGPPIIPTSADSDAEGDMPRGARAQQFRQSRRLQVSSAVPGLALIGLGLLLIFNPIVLTPVIWAGLAVAGIGISLLARFWLNGRRERGLCFLGLTLVLWSAFLTAVIARGLLLERIWPILVMALGLALLCTFLFERIHERSVILPGIALIIAGGVALSFSWPLLSEDWLVAVIALLPYWPIAAIIIAVLLLPRALSRRTS